MKTLLLSVIAGGLTLMALESFSLRSEREQFTTNDLLTIGIGGTCCLLILFVIIIGFIQNAKRLKLATEAAATGDWGAAAALGTAGVGYNGNRYGRPLIGLRI